MISACHADGTGSTPVRSANKIRGYANWLSELTVNQLPYGVGGSNPSLRTRYGGRGEVVNTVGCEPIIREFDSLRPPHAKLYTNGRVAKW